MKQYYKEMFYFWNYSWSTAMTFDFWNNVSLQKFRFLKSMEQCNVWITIWFWKFIFFKVGIQIPYMIFEYHINKYVEKTKFDTWYLDTIYNTRIPHEKSGKIKVSPSGIHILYMAFGYHALVFNNHIWYSDTIKPILLLFPTIIKYRYMVFEYHQ